MSMCGHPGCAFRVTPVSNYIPEDVVGWNHVDTHGVDPGHDAVRPLLRTAHAGTCATCGQDLVQLRYGGVPGRTYHPHTVREECPAMESYEGRNVSTNTTHDQYVPTGDDAPVPQRPAQQRPAVVIHQGDPKPDSIHTFVRDRDRAHTDALLRLVVGNRPDRCPACDSRKGYALAGACAAPYVPVDPWHSGHRWRSCECTRRYRRIEDGVCLDCGADYFRHRDDPTAERPHAPHAAWRHRVTGDVIRSRGLDMSRLPEWEAVAAYSAAEVAAIQDAAARAAVDATMGYLDRHHDSDDYPESDVATMLRDYPATILDAARASLPREVSP